VIFHIRDTLKAAREKGFGIFYSYEYVRRAKPENVMYIKYTPGNGKYLL
jgi:hypothetical protein